MKTWIWDHVLRGSLHRAKGRGVGGGVSEADLPIRCEVKIARPGIGKKKKGTAIFVVLGFSRTANEKRDWQVRGRGD